MRLIDANKLQDYFWDNRSKLFQSKDCRIAIDKAPTVEAIPIEWIEKYIKQNYCTCDVVYPEEFLKELVTW